MYLNRLEKIHDHVRDNVRDEEFNMSVWKCGAVGCAIGHAANIPEFQKLGFKLSVRDGLPESYPIFANATDFGAVENLLDITRADCTYLFSFQSYEDHGEGLRTQFLERISNFIRSESDDN